MRMAARRATVLWRVIDLLATFILIQTLDSDIPWQLGQMLARITGQCTAVIKLSLEIQLGLFARLQRHQK
ncbi:hypothetical protein A9K61_03035 [Stenotrophomonas maltophilia]|nr:hypothetical protein A9K61_03035 [Stenotrophomonas maltophilia]